MYKRMLVAVDGSKTSHLALKAAITLAKELKSEIRLLHIVDVIAAYGLAEVAFPVTEYKKLLSESGEKLLAQCGETVRKSGIACDTKCPVIDTMARRVHDVIEEEARSWLADLIVIGTHGRRGFNHFMLGSVAEAVMRSATVPVLSIRGNQPSQSGRDT